MERVVEEIMPLCRAHYGVSDRRELIAFGGASFSGVCALYAAMHYSHVFGQILAESPSLWIAEGKFLEDMRGHGGEWASRIFLGCGTKEYSATRDHDWNEIDQLLVRYCEEASRLMHDKGVHIGNRQMFQVETGAGHHEGAWGYRLTGSLTWLLESWWRA